MTLQPSYQLQHALGILMGGYPKVKPREQPMHIKAGPTEDRAKDHRSRRLGIDAVQLEASRRFQLPTL